MISNSENVNSHDVHYLEFTIPFIHSMHIYTAPEIHSLTFLLVTKYSLKCIFNDCKIYQSMYDFIEYLLFFQATEHLHHLQFYTVINIIKMKNK